MYLAIIDIVFAGIVVLFIVRGVLRGFVAEFLSMAALVIGLLASIFFFKKAAPAIDTRIFSEVKMLPEIIAFVMIFLITFAAIKLLEKLLKDIIGKIKLTGIDRFLGFFYGIAEGIVIICLLIFLLTIQPFFDPDQLLGNSYFAQRLMEMITGYKKEIMDSIAMCAESLARASGV